MRDDAGDQGSGPAVRRAALACLAVSAAAFAALWALFGAVLPVSDDPGCSTGIPPGAYRDAFAPAHMLAAGAIGAAVLRLHAVRRGGRRAWAVLLLAAVAACALVSFLWPAPIALVALVAMGASVTLGPALGVTLAIRAALVVRREGAQGAWPAHAASIELAGWFALVIGIPATLGFAWVNAASLFCF